MTTLVWGRNPMKGSGQIFQRSVADPYSSPEARRAKHIQSKNPARAIWQPCLGVGGVEDGFDEEEVDAAVQQAAHLLGVGRGQLVKGCENKREMAYIPAGIGFREIWPEVKYSTVN